MTGNFLLSLASLVPDYEYDVSLDSRSAGPN